MTCSIMSPFWIFLDLGLWDSQKGLRAIRHLFPNDKMENGQYQVSMCLKTGNWLYIQTPWVLCGHSTHTTDVLVSTAALTFFQRWKGGGKIDISQSQSRSPFPWFHLTTWRSVFDPWFFHQESLGWAKSAGRALGLTSKSTMTSCCNRL